VAFLIYYAMNNDHIDLLCSDNVWKIV